MSTLTTPDGTEIHYDDEGADRSEGPAVVLVHGITESSATWTPVTERLVTRHRVVTLDLRGHGRSGTAERYDLDAMAGDVVTVIEALGLESPHLVGHSLGGAVVSAVGAAVPVASVVNVDQALQLGGFKEGLAPIEAMLRDPETFGAVIDGLFAQLAGTAISPERMQAVNDTRRPDQTVVLGVWDLIFSSSVEEIDAVVESALTGYDGRQVPYLSLFGIDPGPDYGDWLRGHIDGARVEVWEDHGHYPHLVDPDRFVDRLERFWSSLG